MTECSKPKIGVMGSSNMRGVEGESQVVISARRLGQAIAERGCVLITGATTGLPDLVSRAARDAGGLTIGISPAVSHAQHVSEYLLPDDGADVIIYTGFGLKGRNVINVRTCDVVLIVGGGIGTLNEFTIAFDEGKLVGVLEGSGGAADQINQIAALSPKTSRMLVFESDPVALVDRCLGMLKEL